MPDLTPIPTSDIRQQAAEAEVCGEPIPTGWRHSMSFCALPAYHWQHSPVVPPAEDPTLTSLPGRCADHALTHCFDCGWITPADAAELYRLKRRPDADGSAQLIASIREQISHAAMNGHHLSSDCQGVAPGERPPAVRTANIEAAIEGWLWRGGALT